MNAADQKYRDDFLARGFRKGHRVLTRNCGPGTIVRIGGNCAFVACDQDEPGSERVILFENIEREPAPQVTR
jgi:hypothetical protein